MCVYTCVCIQVRECVCSFMYVSIVWYVCALRKCVPTTSDPLGQNMSQHSTVLINYSMEGGNGTEVDMHQKKWGGGHGI